MEFILKKKIGDEIIEEKVLLERWVWGVIYKDDTEFHQFADDGSFHQFQEIKQEEVKLFTMYVPNVIEHDISKRIDIPVRPGMQLFHFYRRVVLENGAIKKTVYVFGWKDIETGQKHYNYILPDDRIIISDIDINIHNFGI